MNRRVEFLFVNGVGLCDLLRCWLLLPNRYEDEADASIPCGKITYKLTDIVIMYNANRYEWGLRFQNSIKNSLKKYFNSKSETMQYIIAKWAEAAYYIIPTVHKLEYS